LSAYLAPVPAEGIEAGTEGNDLKEYSNDEFAFTIGYPSTWTKEELRFDPEVNTYVVEFDSPPEGGEDRYTDYLGVQIRPFEGSTYEADQEGGDEKALGTLGEYLTLTAYADDLKEVYRNTYDNFQNLSFDLVKLGDRPAYSLVQRHTLELSDGKIDLKVLETGTIVGDKVYSLHYIAEEDKYSKYLPVAEKMIKSFQLVSSSQNINNKGTGSSEVTPDESTSSTSQSGYKSYQNAIHKVEAQVPAEWEIRENDPTPDDSVSEIVYFLAPLTGSADQYHENIGILSEGLFLGNSSLSEYLNYTIDAYAGGLKNFTLNSSNSNAEFIGRPGYSMVYTSSLEGDDLTLKTLEVGSIIGNKSYYVSYNAQPENYEKYLPKVEQIIDSVKILNESSLDLTPPGESAQD
jgi:hypothetical protein